MGGDECALLGAGFVWNVAQWAKLRDAIIQQDESDRTRQENVQRTIDES